MKFSFDMRLKGEPEMKRHLKNAATNAPEQLREAGMAEMEIEKQEMQNRTPVRYGILRDSLEVMAPEMKKRTVVITVGTDVEYAPYVHENLEAFHEVGEAKFIESVLNESEPHMAERIAKHIDLKKMIE
jgi:hypothetical protein